MTQCKPAQAAVIDLFAHYDAVAELMAAAGRRLGNRVGTPNGSASDLRQEVFRLQKERGGGLQLAVRV